MAILINFRQTAVVSQTWILDNLARLTVIWICDYSRIGRRQCCLLNPSDADASHRTGIWSRIELFFRLWPCNTFGSQQSSWNFLCYRHFMQRKKFLLNDSFFWSVHTISSIRSLKLLNAMIQGDKGIAPKKRKYADIVAPRQMRLRQSKKPQSKRVKFNCTMSLFHSELGVENTGKGFGWHSSSLAVLILLAFEKWINCETQPSSIHWLSSSIFPCSSSSVRPSRIGNISIYLHYMMF